MKNDWDDAVEELRNDVSENGGFLTMQRDTLRERFDIKRLTEGLTRELLDTFSESRLIVFPNPYNLHSADWVWAFPANYRAGRWGQVSP